MLKSNNSIILAKVETTSGTDAIPTGAANAIQVSNIEHTPIASDTVDLPRNTGYFGHGPQLLINKRVTIAFDVEVSAAGAADTVPAWAPLLRGCLFNETVTVGTSVSWSPITNNAETLTIYVYRDGVVQKLVGCQGTFTLTLSAGGAPSFRYTFTGSYAGPSDEANPTAALSAFRTPLAVDFTNATLAIHGYDVVCNEFSIDIANAVTSTDIIGSNDIVISERAPVGSATIDYTTVADKNWIDIARAATGGPLAFVLGESDGSGGRTAGTIFKVDCPNISLGAPTFGDRDGILTATIPLRLVPDAGNDEIIITTQ
ncbi:phage tail tube protein [Candidatus Persebacteraceae bacterium Df01]|jgi:hypothetical protein|uniref:Phage tail tube protein n=1 Tax=Candidatus Doriopsillibacter californiensis TaxID=2970740 RepID=A0ABT7QMA4_9GAMM|nr:phage tail tube protein [Candidatus Persebacteraceae bacterium Df01]